MRNIIGGQTQRIVDMGVKLRMNYCKKEKNYWVAHWGLTPMLLSNRTMVSGLPFTTGVSFPLKIMNVVNK